MTKNIGSADAHIRIMVAATLVIIALLIVDNPYLRISMALVGAVMAGTAYLRYCYLYKILGKNTCEVESSAAPVSEKHEGTSPATSDEKSV